MKSFTPSFFCLFCLIQINFAQKTYELLPVTITDERTADTVFGTWKFSVADYEFYEDKLILLTYTKSLSKPTVRLVNSSQQILSSFDLPDKAEKLFRDYMGHVNVICSEHIFRVKINNDEISMASLPVDKFNTGIMPCIDTIGKEIYFSNYSKDYPEFTYYAYNTEDKNLYPFKKITDDEQLKEYNMEYYFLKPKEKLMARKIADEYDVDKHRIAVMMTGLTSSIFYTPLYAPLFIIHDTVYVFDHYSNAILTYNMKHELLDSVTIDYHHPKNWREWKHEVIMDRENNKMYALYQKGAHYYLMHIDPSTGKIIGSFKLLNRFVGKIKIKNDYVYYVYRPFESLQEQFVYKELIRE
jgi:hypothetical protein